jgi:hypothetical protein
MEETIAGISSTLRDVNASLASQASCMKEQARAATRTAAAKEKMASLEIIKMQLQLYTAGSSEHDECLHLLHSLRLSFVIADAQDTTAECDSPTS